MSITLNNKLILGTVQMGLPYGINNSNGRISVEDSMEILAYALESGITVLDSAAAYGDAHQVIGRFHKNSPEPFKVMTKLPNGSAFDMVGEVEKYRKELRVDGLHALLFHSFSSYANNPQYVDELLKVKEEGKVDHIGVSVYTNDELERIVEDERIDIVQLPFNPLDNTNLRGELLRKAKTKGKMVHTRSALLQGLFLKEPDAENETVQALRHELTQLSNISKKYQIPMSRLALGYCLQQETIDNVLIGVDSINQLKENIPSAQCALRPEIIDEINTIQVGDMDLLNPSLWK